LSGSQRFETILLANSLSGLTMVSGAALLPIDIWGLPLLFTVMLVSAATAVCIGHSPMREIGAATVIPDYVAGWGGIRTYALNIWITALLWALVWSRGEYPIVRTMIGDDGIATYAAAMTLFGGAIQAVMLGMK